jgi:hypothetical protein
VLGATAVDDQFYMGALKSQACAGVRSGRGRRCLRFATLGIALLGLLCAMARARLTTADRAGARRCGVDPASCSPPSRSVVRAGFLLRSAAALVAHGWRARVGFSRGRSLRGAVVHNKIDAVVGRGAPRCAGRAGLLREIRERREGSEPVAGFAGCAPMLASAVPALVAALRRRGKAPASTRWQLSALHACSTAPTSTA